MCVALDIRQAVRMRQIVICGLSGSTVVFQIIRQMSRFSGKKKVEHRALFWFFLQLLSETFRILRTNERDVIKKWVLVFM